MFDNPNEELRKMEQKLLAAEQKKNPEAEFEAFYGEILREFGPGIAPRQPGSGSTGKKAAPKKAPKKKEEGIGGLVAVLCLEFAGIAALVIWWILRLW